MSTNPSTNDFFGKPVTSLTMKEQLAGKQASGANKRSDGKYTKAILKGEIKVAKFNSENYQGWADGKKLLLEAKMLWQVVNGTKPLLDSNTWLINHQAWKLDNIQVKAWIYRKTEDQQHNHVKKQATSLAI